jgi:putative ABC transport system permease protein
VSVTERTQEIGLRKAVGARRRDIMVQFLIEAVVLSLLGGLAGVLTTAVLVQLGAVAIQAFAGSAGNDLAQSLTMDLSAMVLALVFASVVGVIAGSYPAFRASRLSPITALRSVG